MLCIQDNLGYSGCRVKIGKRVVVKSGPKRLSIQADIQSKMREKNSFNKIVIPKIYKNITTQTMTHISMEKLEMYNIERIDGFNYNLLFDYIENLLRNAKKQKISSSVFSEKFYQSIERCKFLQETERILLKRNFYDIDILIGDSHGDLSLTNVMTDGIRIGLIDFLDSYINSPILDLIKLRQDTFHGWISYLTKRHIDLEKMDYDLTERFSSYLTDYNILQYVNLARILPYSKSRKDTEFILGQMLCLI